MPAIRDWTFNYGTVTTATTIVAYMPNYAQNDLLIALLSTDTGAQTWTSTGWTQLFTVTSTANLAVMWKIAGATETDPTFTYTVAETANVHLISIRDVNTTTPFNGTGGAGTGYRTGTLSTATGVFPALTTTVANSLVLFGMCESGAVVPTIHQGPCTFEDGSDGSAHSDGFAWTFMPSTGLIPSTVKYAKSGTAAGVQVSIGISPPSGGALVIPPFCAGDNSIFIDPIHGVTAFNGNTAFAATATTDFGTVLGSGTLGNGTIAASADVGINSFHSMGQVTGVTTANVASGGRLALAVGNKPDVTGKNVICHAMPSTPKIYQNTNPVTKGGTAQKGVYFGMASAANNFKIWHIHGAGTPWDSAQHVPIVVNSSNTSGVAQTLGTFNAASVSSFGFINSGFLVATVFRYGSLWALDTTTIAGGNLAEPVGVGGINKVCSSGKERMSVLQQGASQILVLQPIQLGDGGTNPLYLNLNATAIEFPKQYDQASKQVFYCSADNVAGITYYAGASDTIIHTNAVVSSESKYHWKIHASSSTSAAYDFNGLSVIGAGTIQLKAGITFDSITFSKCDEIAAIGATISNCTIGRTTGAGALNIASPAEMALVTDCLFRTNSTYGIRLTSATAQTYSFQWHYFLRQYKGCVCCCYYRNSHNKRNWRRRNSYIYKCRCYSGDSKRRNGNRYSKRLSNIGSDRKCACTDGKSV